VVRNGFSNLFYSSSSLLYLSFPPEPVLSEAEGCGHPFLKKVRKRLTALENAPEALHPGVFWGITHKNSFKKFFCVFF
jgi:hypothetical protein